MAYTHQAEQTWAPVLNTYTTGLKHFQHENDEDVKKRMSAVQCFKSSFCATIQSIGKLQQALHKPKKRDAPIAELTPLITDTVYSRKCLHLLAGIIQVPHKIKDFHDRKTQRQNEKMELMTWQMNQFKLWGPRIGLSPAFQDARRRLDELQDVDSMDKVYEKATYLMSLFKAEDEMKNKLKDLRAEHKYKLELEMLKVVAAMGVD